LGQARIGLYDRMRDPDDLVVFFTARRKRRDLWSYSWRYVVATLRSKIGAVVLPLLPINRRTFDILRHELRAWRTRLINTVNPAYYRRVSHLRSQRDLSVNIGSGGKGLPNWVNIEVLPMRDTTLCLDIRRRLPLTDGSVARILAEHVVEHIDFRDDLPAVLQDWHRVLQLGGVARVIVPNARRFLQAYVSEDAKRWQDLGWDLEKMPGDIYTPMHIINHVFHQGGEHLFAYDFETMEWALRRAGFSTVEQMSYNTSRDPQLAIDQENHAAYSLYIEAVK
jgi:predicted SAM-dependent methyltransferase